MNTLNSYDLVHRLEGHIHVVTSSLSPFPLLNFQCLSSDEVLRSIDDQQVILVLRHQQLHLIFFFPETASFWDSACIPKSTPIHHGRETVAGPGSFPSPRVPLGVPWILLFPVSYVDPDALLFVCWHFTACTRIQGVHVPCRMEKFTRHPPVILT